MGSSLSKTTVRSILREHGFDLGPKRGQGTWSEFIERHGGTDLVTICNWCKETGRVVEIVFAGIAKLNNEVGELEFAEQ